MAAHARGLAPFEIADIVAELGSDSEEGVLWVESAGGVRSPRADDGDTVSLCDALRPDLVVLVADAGLGTINAVTLSADALADQLVVVVLNRFDEGDALHIANLGWLRDRSHLDVVADLAPLVSRLADSVKREPLGAPAP
jgi:dethiobiotin synthetase